MFDAKKLLDALGQAGQPSAATPAATPAPAEPPKPAAPAASPIGAGSLLSDLIGLANRPDPAPAPPPAEKAEGEPDTPPKPKPAQQPADLTDLLLGKAQEYLKTPQGNAAMNALVLGIGKAVANSQTGRKVATSAVTKGTALFNRFMNKDTAPLAAPASAPALPPPSPEASLLMVRTMIAAAAADGVIDDAERQRILGSLRHVEIDGQGMQIMEAELANPASVADLAASARTLGVEVQTYTVARTVITPNTVEERVFLAHLAGALGLDPKVVAQIDASA